MFGFILWFVKNKRKSRVRVMIRLIIRAAAGMRRAASNKKGVI